MINAAIVGLGAYAARMVSAVHGRSAKLRFVSGVTRNPGDRSALAAQHGIALTSDYGAVLADPEIDAVVLATPHSLHARQAQQAAQAGKHVFVEKPLALTGADAADTVRVCRACGVVLAVGYNSRFRPALRELKRIVQSGMLGTVLHLEAHLSGPPGRGGSALRGSWRNDRAESPAGGMTGKGVHLVDQMIWLTGEVESVWAQSERRVLDADIDDTTAVMLRFANGATGYLGTLLSTPYFWRLHVFGSQGWAEVRDERLLSVCTGGRAVKVVEYPETDTRLEQLDAFADAIAGKGAFLVNEVEAAHGAAVLEAITRSALRHETVRVMRADDPTGTLAQGGQP